MTNLTFTSVSLDVFITFIPVMASLGLAFIVYGKNKNDLSNKIFAVSCLAIVFWTAANYFSRHPILISALTWIRLVMLLAVFMQFAFFIFVYLFPQNKLLMKKWKLLILSLLALATMSVSLSPFLYSRLEIKNGLAVPSPGPLMPLFAFTIFLFLGLSFFYIFKKYRFSQGVEKIQWRLIASGFSIMFFLLVVSQFLLVVFSQKTDFIKFGPIFTMPFIVFASYAIVKHHLFNVKVIAAELLVGAILLTLLIQVFVAPTVGGMLWNLLLFVVVGILSVFLIRSVIKEVESKKQIQNLADNLKEANLELQKLDKTKSEFLSIASHQLRTPLTAIKGYLSLILENTYGKFPIKLGQPLKNVYISSERLIKLINTLLNISRIDEGKVELNPEKSSLWEMVSNIVQELKVIAQEKGVNLRFLSPKDSFPATYVDPEKIRQAILNIIDNAIRYTSKGEVAVELQASGNKLQIITTDTGEGMDKEEMGNLFNIFSRGKTGYKSWAEGTGLGLYVAKKFVEMHGGAITVESPGKGMGSTFCIELPIK